MFNQKPYSIKVGIYLPKIYLYHTAKYKLQFYKDKTLYKECSKRVIDYFTSRYGGCTRVEAVGSYRAINVTNIVYNIHEQIIYANMPEDSINEQELYDLCSDCCKILRQDTIAIEVNNEMYFISGKE